MARGTAARVLAGLLAVSLLVVPCLFTTRLSDAFTVPKLAALWLLLIASLLVVAAARLVDAPTGAPLRWTPAVDVALVAFVLLQVLALAASTDRRQSLFGERLQHQGLLTSLLYVGLFVLARHVVYDVRRLTLLFAGITAGALVVAAYAILQRAGVDPFWRGDLPEGRVFSTIGQPNALAAYLVLCLAPAGYLARMATGARRAGLLAGTAGIAVALLLTLSRGGLVALVVMGVLSVGLLAGRRRLAAAAAVVVAAAAAAIALARWRGEGGLSTRNHLDTWYVAGRIALDQPILGTGQETFPDVFPVYSATLLSPDRVAYFSAFRVESAHNVYLTMAASTGLLSLLAYLALVVGITVLALRVAGSTPDAGLRLGLIASGLAVAGHLASDAFLTAEITGTWLFWTLLGAATGAASGFAPRSDRRSPRAV